MNLEKKDRVILANQYRILIALGAQDKSTYERWVEALEEGFESAYAEIFNGVEDGLTLDQSEFVINVLCMYDALQRAYKALPDTSGIEEQAILFPGFDGNDESAEWSYARFVRDREGRFDYLRVEEDDLNSHMPRHEVYERMLRTWKDTKRSYELTHKQVLAILDAQIHPDRRGN